MSNEESCGMAGDLTRRPPRYNRAPRGPRHGLFWVAVAVSAFALLWTVGMFTWAAWQGQSNFATFVFAAMLASPMLLMAFWSWYVWARYRKPVLVRRR